MINKEAYKKPYSNNRFNTNNNKFDVNYNSQLNSHSKSIPIIDVNSNSIQLTAPLLSLNKEIKKTVKVYIKRKLETKNIIRRRYFKQLLRPDRPLKQFKYRNIRTNHTYITQKKFIKFFKNNNLYNNFNLRQDFPYPNYLQSKSEIQRATVFRDLINKEEAYYKSFSKNPLVILLSPKPKNIYITVYSVPESTKGYRIYWKKSTGMLQKVEGQLSFPAVVELFNKLNIFLAKEFLHLQNPVKLIIKSTKFYGTKHLIQNFVKIAEQNMNLHSIYFMYKYRKRFNFFNNYANLINDSVFNYLTDIWLKFLKLLRRTKLPPAFTFTKTKFRVLNHFLGIKYKFGRGRPKLDHFIRLKRYKFLKNKKYKKPIKTLIFQFLKNKKYKKSIKKFIYKIFKNKELLKNKEVLSKVKNILYKILKKKKTKKLAKVKNVTNKYSKVTNV